MKLTKRFVDEIRAIKPFAHELKSWRTVFYFFFPWALYGLYILVVFLLFPPNLNWQFITITFLYLIPPAGKESMVPAGVFLLRQHFGLMSIIITAVSIAFVDVFVGLWMMWNWDLIKLIPFLGTYVRKLEEIGEKKWKKHKYLSGLAYTGLAFFVAFPFQGSGAVGSTVIGRVLGMNPRKIFYSIIFGSLLGCFLIAIASYFAIFSFKMINKSLLIYVGIVIFVVVFIVAYIWLRGGKK